MSVAITLLLVVSIVVGLVFAYLHAQRVNTSIPLKEEQKIETDFDAKKKAEVDRIGHLDQEDLLEELNKHRPGGG